MTRLVLSTELPIGEIAAEVAKLMRDADRGGYTPPPQHRSPTLTIQQGARNVARALTRYENAVNSRDEQPALAGLIAASKGLRKALQTEKHPINGKD